MLDRSQRKQGPTTNAEKKLANMRHAAVGFWLWQKNEKKKRERAANKKHKKEEEEQAAKKLAAAQKALDTLQEEEEYDYEGASVKEEPDTEVAAQAVPPIAGPFNFVDPQEYHDFKQEPLEEEEYPAEDLPQANGDNEPMQAKPGCSAVKEAARTVKVTEEIVPTKTAAKKNPTRANLKKKTPCPVCSKMLASAHMKDHLRVHSDERPYPCTVCTKKTFRRKEHLMNHLRIHTGEKPFNCGKCDKRFALKAVLQRHEAHKHSGERPHKCDICSASFASQWQLKRHSKKVHKVLASAHMKDHLLVHSDERRYPCTVCTKTFRRKQTLLIHMRVHTGEKPFNCGKCDKRFALKAVLQRHEAHKHSGERPHKCDKCSARFVKHWELTRHSKTHTSGGPIFPCKTCGRAFSRNKTRSRHSNKCQAPLLLRCSAAECGESFARKDHLQKHLQAHAGQKRRGRENIDEQNTKGMLKTKSPCRVCGGKFVSGDMKRHMRSHTGERPHPCTVCGKAFRRAHHLLDHMRTHTGERPFKCDDCGKRFVEETALRRHKAYMHSGDRPLKCDTCPASFVSQSELTRHSKIHTSGGPIFPCKTCGRAFSRNDVRCRHSKNCRAV